MGNDRDSSYGGKGDCSIAGEGGYRERGFLSRARGREHAGIPEDHCGCWGAFELSLGLLEQNGGTWGLASRLFW